MTIWTPELSNRSGPRYLAIADALADGIKTGALNPGERLPTHRELAFRLGVTVGTVSRAYAEAARRGLTQGEVGRGTFVNDIVAPEAAPDSAQAQNRRDLSLGVLEGDRGRYDFSLNLPVTGNGVDEVARILSDLAQAPELAAVLEYQPDTGLSSHRQAGSTWIEQVGMKAPLARIIATNGSQHGMATVFMATTQPGDLVLTEILTYPGMKGLAAMLRLRLLGLAMDRDGLLPDAFEEACRERKPKALFLMPTIQNPTTATMPVERRKQIAAIADKHDITLIEDDTYIFLPGRRPPPVAAFAPERTYFITSLSKCLAPGLRVGYVLAPDEAAAARVGAAVRDTCRMATPMMAEVGARLIHGGGAGRMAVCQCEEAHARQKIAGRILDGLDFRTNAECLHIWLSVPEPWRTNDLVSQAGARDVIVIPAEAFAVGRAQPPHAIRICFGAMRGRERVESGLKILRKIIDQQPRSAFSVI
jgi:DNA-binding transcriptional MocR family regulator